MTELEGAIKTLVKNLKEDPAYRVSWKANIAMAFKDESSRRKGVLALTPTFTFDDAVNEIANRAADNFLDLLCMEQSE